MRTNQAAIVALLTALSACSGEQGATEGSDSEGAVKLGSKGPEVRALYDYLKTYGYFENPELRAQYPGWQPIVGTEPSNPEVFDAALEDGLLEYQKLMGLEETGEVDEATQRMIDTPRCGHPDVDPDRLDPSRKFALFGGSAVWNHTNITYAFSTGTNDITDEWDQVQRAFRTWSTYSGLKFSQHNGGFLDILLIFRSWVPATNYGQGGRPDNSAGTGVSFNDLNDWRTTNLNYVATHEIGHSIGLAHSSVPGAVMFPGYDGTSPVPDLLPTDDRMAVGALYSSWGSWPGAGLDISYPTNGNTDPWVIGTDGFVYRWNISAWSLIPNGPIPPASPRRIAAATATRAAVVTTSRDVYEFVNGTWRQIPGKCIDIAYRSDANSTPSLYCVGTDANAYRWVNSHSVWAHESGVSSVQRIASGPIYNHPEYGTDVVWVVLTDGSIKYRLDGVNWTAVPAPKRADGKAGPADDIAVGIDGSVWIVGGDFLNGGSGLFGSDVYIWNEQAAFGTAPSRNQWLKIGPVPGRAVALTVDRWGKPWVVNTASAFFYRK